LNSLIPDVAHFQKLIKGVSRTMIQLLSGQESGMGLRTPRRVAMALRASFFRDGLGDAAGPMPPLTSVHSQADLPA